MSVFSEIPVPKHSRSAYRLTPTNTMSLNWAGLYPILTRTVLPGDKWSINVQTFLRSMPLISPVLGRNDIKIDSFYVPFRLIWKSAEKWLQCDTTIKTPKIYCSVDLYYNRLFGPGSLYDYFNFGTPLLSDLQALNITVDKLKRNALPLRAYRMIYDFYYRNKALEQEITDVFPDFYGDSDIVVGSPFNLIDFLSLQRRSWRRDLFTSALPTPQTGSDVLIPSDLSGTASGLAVAPNGPMYFSTTNDPETLPTDNNLSLTYPYQDSNGGHGLRVNGTALPAESVTYSKGLRVTGDRVNLRNQATIRQLRYAEQLEKYEEAMARAGFGNLPGYGHGKFKEWLRGIWGQRSSDARLDRPEYLGGYRGPIQISEVPQTSVSTVQSPQANLAGKGLSVGGNRLFRNRTFEEPGIIMVIVSVTPKSAYCQGDPREWLYESGYDFPNPFFDHLGEQDVKMDEINCLATAAGYGGTFGYNIRNYEMKDFPDEVHGQMRTTLAYWHEGRIFPWDNFPGLNEDFVKVHPSDVSRMFPSTVTSDKLVGQFFFDVKLRRNLSYYGLPKQNP